MKLSEKIRRSIVGKERYEEEVEKLQPSSLATIGTQELTLSEDEKCSLKDILDKNKEDHCDVAGDYLVLKTLTGEIKSINHQSVLLHGDRIFKAQKLFKGYGEYAFSRWLKEVYGNRQTPYNFLKYYLFYSSLDKRLKEKALSMPKQIIYTIASRNCSDADKERVVDTYEGESKETYLKAIRKAFPLKQKDRRQKKEEDSFKTLLFFLNEARNVYEKKSRGFSLEELRKLDALLKVFSKELWED